MSNTIPIDRELARETLRELGDLQNDCAEKAKRYRITGEADLALRFERAALYGSNARTFIQAAYMAELEQGKCELI